MTTDFAQAAAAVNDTHGDSLEKIIWACRELARIEAAAGAPSPTVMEAIADRLAALAGAAPVAWASPSSLAALDACRNDDHNGCIEVWMRPTDEHTIPLTHAPAKAREDWQPIATAPKDWSTRIDVWDGSERIADVWWGIPTYDGKEPGWIVCDDYDCNGPVDSYVRPQPTHWRPLPASPAALATFAEEAE